MSMLRLISDERILERETKISRMETKDRHNPAPQKSDGGGADICYDNQVENLELCSRQFGRLL